MYGRDGGYCKGKQKDDAECLPFSKRDAFLYYMNEVSGYVFTRTFEKNARERLEIDDHAEDSF
ncbi:MAG: hypothetical protein ACLUTA_16350 [Blautia wexlerae]